MLEKFHSLNEIIAGSSRPDVARLLSRLKKEGKVIRIAPRVYTTNLTDSPENIVRRNIWAIVCQRCISASSSAVALLYCSDKSIAFSFEHELISCSMVAIVCSSFSILASESFTAFSALLRFLFISFCSSYESLFFTVVCCVTSCFIVCCGCFFSSS